MSRIGKRPIELPAGVNVSISPGRVMVNGPLGELSQAVPQRMQIEQGDGQILVTRPTERGAAAPPQAGPARGRRARGRGGGGRGGGRAGAAAPGPGRGQGEREFYL